MTKSYDRKANLFEDYLRVNLDSARQGEQAGIIKRNEFLEKYPLERIKELTPEEYCLGTDNSKESLSYLMEFGKIGFGIGGGSARKHGVYFSKKENCYMNGSTAIEDIEEFWPRFKESLYNFIVKSGSNEEPLVLEDYPLLQGMAMVLTKYLSMYFPEKYISIGSFAVLKELMDHFGYPYEDGMRCHQLNGLFSKNIRKDYEDLKFEDGWVIGNVVWNFMDGEEKKHHEGGVKTNKESGLGDEDVNETHYWIYSPGTNASKWDDFSNEGVMGIGWEELGDLSAFNSRKEMQDKMKDIWGSDKSYKMDSLATWQFANDIKVGDVIYAKKGMYKVVGRGVVTSDYFYNEDVPEGEYRHYRKVDWKDIGEWPHPGQAVMKTLTDITSYTDYVQKLEALFIDDDDEVELVEEAEKTWPVYSKTKFLEEVYMDEDTYNTLTGLIDTKKNVILQGAPGVGKTYAANRLAYSIMGEKNKDRVMMVQFHQSYSYEDFIEGFRPASEGSGFEIKKGSFYNFCKKAADDLENKYFFIIDEINRGNLSKIFGELFMLIEKDKRGNSLQLLYSDEKFFVPQNIYIIGMMNTADRSLAMLDYALRRRFAFFEIKPAFDQARFIEYRMGLDNAKFNSLIECVKKLNEKIKEDPSLGEGFCIGHSYFCDLKDVNDAILNGIVEYELVPLLKEYWFDDQTMVRDWTEKLRSSIK